MIANRRERVRQWSRLIADFALATGFGQAAGMLSGLIYVRIMPVEQYALYALCLTALTVTALGSDLGVTSSLSYFWRKGLQEGRSIAPKIALVRRVRTILLAASMLLGATFVLTSASEFSVSRLTLAACLGLVAATAILHARIGVDLVLARLEGRQRTSYLCEATGSVVRLLAAVTMIVVGSGAAWFGLAGGLLGAAATAAAFGSQPVSSGSTLVGPGPHDVREMRAYWLPVIPSVVVYMLQDPVVLWLAAVRGGGALVGEMHALGRIGALVSLLAMFSSVVLSPRLAGVTDNARYVRLCGIVLLGMSLVLAFAVGATCWFPNLPLLIIGPKYGHLQTEVAVTVGISAIASLTWFLSTVNRGRGWVALDTLFALLQGLVIAVLAYHWSFATTAAALGLMLTLAGSAFLCVGATFVLGIVRPELVSVQGREQGAPQ